MLHPKATSFLMVVGSFNDQEKNKHTNKQTNKQKNIQATNQTNKQTTKQTIHSTFYTHQKDISQQIKGSQKMQHQRNLGQTHTHFRGGIPLANDEVQRFEVTPWRIGDGNFVKYFPLVSFSLRHFEQKIWF